MRVRSQWITRAIIDDEKLPGNPLGLILLGEDDRDFRLGIDGVTSVVVHEGLCPWAFEVSFVTKTTIHRVVSVAEHFQSCSKVAQK